MGEKTKIGYVPAAKIASIVPAKVWTQYKKDSEALGIALRAAGASKAAVVAALAAKLNLDPALTDFGVNSDGLVIRRLAAPKKAGGRRAELPDLTAAA
jgi:hypothetical protein